MSNIRHIKIKAKVAGYIWMPYTFGSIETNDMYFCNTHNPFINEWNGIRNALDRVKMSVEGNFRDCKILDIWGSVEYESGEIRELVFNRNSKEYGDLLYSNEEVSKMERKSMIDPPSMNSYQYPIKYIVTGITTSGKRFRLEYKNFYFANGINLYKGSLWREQNGKRKLLKKVNW